ncbi:MAG: lipocalin family protein [Calditrichaeota bacterium]|nr:lipocalin family protein [Calditrichota bacterium]
MRKLTNLLLVILLFSGFTLIGCLDDDDSNPSSSSSDLVGIWSLTGISLNGIDIPVDEFGEMTITFNDNGTGSYVDEDHESSSFTWSVSGGKLMTTEDGVTDTVDYSVSGNTLIVTVTDIDDSDSTATEEIMIMTFTKQ